ncbi:unnamed protein product [marine sediment metagenome]|uniref:Uncharacterized protein n=1 Tax=marine sediment metagenome TaxID=412755 RepID=X0TC45_9ZZZZ
MAYIHFDSQWTPCGFMIVRDGGNPRSEQDTLLVEIDYDYPGIASRMGYVPCDCGDTDGTVDCAHKTATQMIGEARQWIKDHEGKSFAELDEYINIAESTGYAPRKG